MKRSSIIAITALLGLAVAGCGTGGSAGNDAGVAGSAGTATSAGNGAGSTGQHYRACELFTLDEAKKVIGVDAKPYLNNGKADTSMGDLAVSLCGYSDGADKVFASTLVRSATTDGSRQNNDRAFTNARAAGAKDVSGYGDKAYFDATTGQLSVLAKGQYLIFDNGRGLDGANYTLADAQKLADIVLPDLK